MGGMLLSHHHISPNPLQKTAFPGSFAFQKDVLLFCAPRQGFLRRTCATIVSEANGAASPDAVRKRSKDELIAFFKDIQTSVAESSPKASRRTGKPKQSYGMGGGDGGADDVSEEERKVVLSLEDMKVADLRELARARRMRGYSKLKKGELIDRLKGVIQ